MAKKGGNPQNLIKSKKGDPSPNPNGRPKLSEIEREVREADRATKAEWHKKYRDMYLSDVKTIIKDQSVPLKELIYLKALVKDYQNSSLYNTSILENRMHGAPKQSIDIEGNLNHNINPRKEAEEFIKELMQSNESC